MTSPTSRGAPGTSRRSGAHTVEWLIDNSRAYASIVRLIARAQKRLWISQLAFDPDCIAYAAGPRGESVTLLDVVVAAAARGVDVRILLNASLLLDTGPALRAAVSRREPRVQLRGVSRFPQLLHTKMLIADDDDAVLVGSPFVNGYWDRSRHAPVDGRRPHRELGGRPLHDVSVHLRGRRVRSLAAAFDEMWTELGGDNESGPATRACRRVSHGTRSPAIARTTARGMVAAHPRGRTEILDALLRGIGSAESTIYIEHQYLSARPIVDALVAALRRAPKLEIVMLLNQNPDITAYRGWQSSRLRESGLLGHARVGVFALWAAGASSVAGRRLINQVFVHSKVVTIDDRWATVGSANLDGVSLHSYGDDFAGRIGRRLFRHVRNFDVNLVLHGRNAGERAAVRRLRRRLWREHLGDEEASSPATSALERWRTRAAASVAWLAGANVAEPADARTLILPYSLAAAPHRQLSDAGLLLDFHRLDLCFNPGWLEIHASPNWIRNMFA